MNPKAKIPESRKAELKKILEEFYGVTDFSPEILEQAAQLEYRVDNENYNPHGKAVVRHVQNDGAQGLHNFEKRWRKHFVEVMKPQFLPRHWSIHHRHERHDVLDGLNS